MYDARDAPPDGRIPAWKWNCFVRETAEAFLRYTAIPGNQEKLEAKAAIIRERREERERIRAAGAGAET